MTEPGRPRAAAYQRISKDVLGDGHGVANQLADQERLASQRGYEITLTASDNDMSALTGRHRPGYERVMAAAARGEIDVILIFQLSRFWRNRVERAQGIKILQEARVSIIATRGPSLDMATAYGRAMAGLLGEFDTMESEVKGERQQLHNHAAALAGKIRKGTPAPFGWQPDRITACPVEGAAVLAACRAVLAGGTVTGVARDWDRLGLRPHQSPYGPLPRRAWTRNSVKVILLNPRIAGIAAYKGAELGRGEWEPLVPEETWRAAAEVIRTSHWRMSTRGVTSLLGGIGYCRCGNYVTGSTSAGGLPAYRCNPDTRNGRPGAHVHVKREAVDEAIGAAVCDFLGSPEAAELLAPAPDGNVAALQAEAEGLRHRLARLGQLYVDGTISEQVMLSGRESGEARLAELEAELAAIGRGSALAPLLGHPDPAAVWEALTLDRRRAIVGMLMTVTLHPSGRGARRFNPDVTLPPGEGIVWKME